MCEMKWKKRMRLIAVLGLASMLAAGSASALTMSITASSTGVGVGAIIDVTLSVSGLTNPGAPSLGAFDVDISYAASVLAFQPTPAIAFDPGTELGGLQCPSPGPGCEVLTDSSVTTVLGVQTLDLAASSLVTATLDGSQSDSFVLATFKLKAIGAGSTALTFTQLVAGDASPIRVPFTSIGQGPTVTISVSPLPEPGLWALLVPASLLALRGRGRL